MDFLRGIACALLASYVVVAAVSCAILYLIGKSFWNSFLKPTLQYFWFCFSDDLNPFLLYCQLGLILFATATITTIIAVAVHFWPDFPVTATVITWASAVTYTLWIILKPILGGTHYQFESPMSQAIKQDESDPTGF